MQWDGASYDTDPTPGYFGFNGYATRNGNLVTNGACNNKPMGPDCVPTKYEHVPVTDKEAQYRDSSADIGDMNYDIIHQLQSFFKKFLQFNYSIDRRQIIFSIEKQ